MINNDNTEIAYIYILIDPRDNVIRYVGKTIHPKTRLRDHIYESKNYDHHRAKWLRSLIKKGIKPILKIIKICPLSEFEIHETYFISLFYSRKLTNSDSTGQGFSSGVRKSIRIKAKKKLEKIVYQYNLSSELINTFKSVEYAGKKLKISPGNISKCCNYKVTHASGFIFRYNEEFVDKLFHANAVKKSVIELDKNDNPIKEWNSVMNCSRDTGIDSGNLSKVCNNKLTHIHKRIFRFGTIFY